MSATLAHERAAARRWTWNVGRLYSPTHNNRLDDADVPRVARVLDELDPDVALLQELVDVRQLDEIVGAPVARARRRSPAPWPRAAPTIGAPPCVVRRERAPRSRSTRSGRPTATRSSPASTLGDGRARGGDLGALRRLRRRAARRAGATRWRARRSARRARWSSPAATSTSIPAWAAGTANARDVATFTRLTRSFADAGRDAGATLIGLLRVDHLLVRGAPALARARVTATAPARRSSPARAGRRPRS